MSTQSQDILHALNNQIKHEGPQETINQPAEEAPPPPPKATIRKKKPEKKEKEVPLEIIPEASTVHKDPTDREPQFSTSVMRDEETHEPPECLVEILTKQLGGDISEGLSEVQMKILRSCSQY